MIDSFLKFMSYFPLGLKYVYVLNTATFLYKLFHVYIYIIFVVLELTYIF